MDSPQAVRPRTMNGKRGAALKDVSTQGLNRVVAGSPTLLIRNSYS